MVWGEGQKQRPPSVHLYLLCASVHCGGGEVVSAVWAMLATNTRDRQIITPSESGDPAIVCVCVCVCVHADTSSTNLLFVFHWYSLSLFYFIRNNPLHTGNQSEPTAASNPCIPLSTCLLCRAPTQTFSLAESQKSGLPRERAPNHTLPKKKKHDEAGRCPLEENDQLWDGSHEDFPAVLRKLCGFSTQSEFHHTGWCFNFQRGSWRKHPDASLQPGTNSIKYKGILIIIRSINSLFSPTQNMQLYIIYRLESWDSWEKTW